MADEAPLIAGKFKDEAALEQSLREGLKATTGVELPPSVKVIGEGGLYKDVEAAVAGYKGVESALGKLRAPQPKGDDKPLSLAKPEPKPAVEIDDPAEALKAAGIDWNDIEQTVREKGKPSDDHYAKLKAVGWTKAAVNAYVQGETAKRQAGALSYNATVASLGGKDKIEQLIASVKDRIPSDQIDTLDSMLKDAKTLPIAVKSLEAYAAGDQPQDIARGGAVPPTNGIKREDLPALIRKAAAGDRAAMAAVSRIDTNAILGRKG